MPSKGWVAFTAYYQNGVHWKENQARILEYFSVSTGQTWTQERARRISWCTYFAHWCLKEANISPLPAVGTSESLKEVGGSVGRFLKYSPEALKHTGHKGNGVYNFHSVASGKYKPQAGDLYYMPKHYDHVGVIIGVSGDNIWTADGNSGPSGWDPKFYVSYDHGKPVKRIGDGFVYSPQGPKKLGVNDFYIEVPES